MTSYQKAIAFAILRHVLSIGGGCLLMAAMAISKAIGFLLALVAILWSIIDKAEPPFVPEPPSGPDSDQPPKGGSPAS